ncbi:uncharacterized protein FIBRA_06087 [Fibroporia radiculosa]|uniref:Zeta-coat protein n=1 Tax=Fibroporia radiculosa TaxID=599839 RepID=J4GS61_9APHY|nr:uncharacterized protein FIBRA_06087 [Fibroporia radiculosa]CCM03935.1 predicted protein [Fibroporia radiculosa]
MDTDGHRVIAKYYHPKSHPHAESQKLRYLKEQRAFEKGLYQKTKRAGGDIILYDSHLVVYKHSLDLIFCLIADPSENELMVHSALTAFCDAVHLLLRRQVEKRGVLENLDLVLLCLDEIFDDGVMVETDPTAIASRGPDFRTGFLQVKLMDMRHALCFLQPMLNVADISHSNQTNQFIMELPYDVLAIGNHELYDYANTYDMYTNFAPHWNGRYLSSNVNITVFDGNNNTISVPVGSRYTKFKTRKGRSITSLGVLYDFTGNDVNTTVQTVADMVKEEWFAEAIAEEPDVFVLLGHMPVRYDNWPTVYDAVRAVHPTTPILIFGGHTHIRDCTQFDGRSMALESGRYMETVGWMSANLDVPKDHNITFTRRYLDANRVTYEYHTGRSNFTYDTAAGQGITQGLLELAVDYDLSYLFGYAPQDYTLSRNPYPSNGSVLTLYVAEAMPYALTINSSRILVPNIMIVNSGELRFDVLSGSFTKNDQLTAAPFTDSFLYIPNITFSVASLVLPALNKAGADEKRSLEYMEREMEKYAMGDVSMRYNAWLEEMNERHMERRETTENLNLGYVTQDLCPGVGDDTPHIPVPYYSSPDFISSNPPSVSNDTLVDLVFINFIETQLLEILNGVQSDKAYTDSDVLSYSPTLANAVLGLYAVKYWN